MNDSNLKKFVVTENLSIEVILDEGHPYVVE